MSRPAEKWTSGASRQVDHSGRWRQLRMSPGSRVQRAHRPDAVDSGSDGHSASAVQTEATHLLAPPDEASESMAVDETPELEQQVFVNDLSGGDQIVPDPFRTGSQRAGGADTTARPRSQQCATAPDLLRPDHVASSSGPGRRCACACRSPGQQARREQSSSRRRRRKLFRSGTRRATPTDAGSGCPSAPVMQHSRGADGLVSSTVSQVHAGCKQQSSSVAAGDETAGVGADQP
jgi:hypothetical protein